MKYINEFFPSESIKFFHSQLCCFNSLFNFCCDWTDKTRGCVSRGGMLAMVFKLTKVAEQKWYKLKGSELLVQVIQGIRFKDGTQVNTHKVAA